jgi:hypothetical protein
MKHTSPDVFLSRELLSFVRDHNPTVEEFITRFAGTGSQGLHILRKHEIIIVEGDRVRLSRRHLSPDGQRFVWGIRIIHLDEDLVDIVRWGPDGPPIWSDIA